MKYFPCQFKGYYRSIYCKENTLSNILKRQKTLFSHFTTARLTFLPAKLSSGQLLSMWMNLLFERNFNVQ